MVIENLNWEYGCCARTAQLSVGDSTVLVTNIVADGIYRVEVYVNNQLVNYRDEMNSEQLADHLLSIGIPLSSPRPALG